MQFKRGGGWEAAYDEERNIYTGIRWGFGCTLYEINENLWDQLSEDMGEEGTGILSKGRRLYMEVNDRCGPPYTIVFDEDYKKLAPWVNVSGVGEQWPTEMTDAVVEVMESEKDNREQRRKKRKEREEKGKKKP